MDHNTQNTIVNFVWSIADDVLRDVYVRGKYRDVILPMTVIRRLDALLEPTKEAVLRMKQTLDAAGIANQHAALCQASGEAFYNDSPFTLKDLKNRAKAQQLEDDFKAYLDGFSPNVQEILDKFKFRNQIPTLREANILGALLEKYLNPAINGLPIATFELKNKLTKQTVADAVEQYKNDRDPKEWLFQFGRCLVHFALDDHEVRMCTHLNGKASWFLPFNRGYNDGAGNPPNPNGIATDFLWKEILTKHRLTDILENYAQVVEEKDEKTGKKKRKQIFLRYHQLRVVRKLLADAQQHGVGKRYLIQHSAGSGKSNSIAWLARQLVGLERAGKPLFDSIIVVTDRRILDKQIRDTIKAFAQVGNVVGHAEDSGDLRRFITEGKQIIITTVQKFPFILGEIGNEHRNNTFAILIDAHQVYTPEQVEDLVKHYLDGAPRDTLDPILDSCVIVYCRDLDEDAQVDFKSKAKAFVRTYAFLAAILPYTDAGWEKLSIFLNLLISKLPAPKEEDLSKGILDTIDMDSYRAEVQGRVSVTLADEDAELTSVQPVVSGGMVDPELERLSHIVQAFNNLFGGFPWKDKDKISRVIAEEIPVKVAADPAYQNAMKHSGKQNARLEHDRALNRVMLELIADHTELFKQFSDNPSFKHWLGDTIFSETYRELRP